MSAVYLFLRECVNTSVGDCKWPTNWPVYVDECHYITAI